MLDVTTSGFGYEDTHSQGQNPSECGSHSRDPMRRWYVVQTHPRQEAVAQRELQQQEYQAFCPMVARESRLGVFLVPLFPGYIFAQFDISKRWRSIASTRGVSRLLSASPEQPIPVPPGVVEELVATASLRSVITRIAPPLIAAGATVRVTDGPFADQSGICLWSDDRRVRLLMDLLGGKREVAVPRSHVEPVGTDAWQRSPPSAAAEAADGREGRHEARHGRGQGHGQGARHDDGRLGEVGG